MLPFKSLDAVTVTGAGAVLDLERCSNRYTLLVNDSGTPTGGAGAVAALEGSPDGSVWFQVAGVQFFSNNHGAAVTTPGGSVSGAEAAHYVRYLRANLTATDTGRVISAWIMVPDLTGEE